MKKILNYTQVVLAVLVTSTLISWIITLITSISLGWISLIAFVLLIVISMTMAFLTKEKK